MRVVPVPELIVVLVVALAVLGPRTLWRLRRARFTRPAESVGQRDNAIVTLLPVSGAIIASSVYLNRLV
jgi:hypothetical protein